MNSFKNRWEIQKNWQLIFPLLGTIGLLFSSYLITKGILKSFIDLHSPEIKDLTILSGVIIVVYFILLRITLWLFKKLEPR
ncbi:MAG: hypothetical protein HRT68_14155, partial [Flavobacteriaceae bacterium]|nr:hypothetical protein [Flavobacteriaceae bacterium]